MALIGFLLASVVNIFLHSTALYWLVTYAGVLIFVGLTAYDTQKIKSMMAAASPNDVQKVAIFGALRLYLDFINLFLLLLRILGAAATKRRTQAVDHEAEPEYWLRFAFCPRPLSSRGLGCAI